MRAQRSWPQRFRVVIHIGPDASIPYSVVTWLAEEKAIALAVAAHTRRYRETYVIDDVEVQDLGPAGRDEQGEIILDPKDLTDRREF